MQGSFSDPAFTLGQRLGKAHPPCFLPRGRSHSAAAVEDGFSRGAASSREREVPGLGSANGREAKKAAEAGRLDAGLVAGQLQNAKNRWRDERMVQAGNQDACLSLHTHCSKNGRPIHSQSTWGALLKSWFIAYHCIHLYILFFSYHSKTSGAIAHFKCLAPSLLQL